MALEQFLFQKLNEQLPFTPSSDQQELFRRLAAFLCAPARIFVLNGYAGTGKTSAMIALVRTLQELEMPVTLLAPTGRSAKVLANYTGTPAHTIHKTIYRSKMPTADQEATDVHFTLMPNKRSHGLFIVDEASLLSNHSGVSRSVFGSGRLLDDLMEYVLSGVGNRLILLGDSAQLPPIGLSVSPSLDPAQLEHYAPVQTFEMTQVLRQSAQSGILYNATLLRHHIVEGVEALPTWKTAGFSDFHLITSGELMETLSDAISKYGLEEVAVLCRSNKRANKYNAGIRGRILYREEALVRGDRVMVVKNNYNVPPDLESLDFIANGDMAQVVRLGRHTERYGFHYVEATLSFPDYDHIELDAKLLCDTLDSESPSLSEADQNRLYTQVAQDYAHLKGRRKQYEAVMSDPYFNALQIKYATALTCHKAQGGQWQAVFVDKAFFDDICTIEMLRWYYTAFTRAQKELYLVNFK